MRDRLAVVAFAHLLFAGVNFGRGYGQGRHG